MLVLTLTDCPPALRGDLTKWLQEIDTGVYVGHVSARVRDELWKKVCDNAKRGRATIVFSARNEQGMDFRVHNASWQPIDFDGLKLMLRPAPSPVPATAAKYGASSAAKIHMAHAMGGKPRRKTPMLERYAVVDLETTGLSAAHDEIIEIGALIVCAGQIEAEFQALLRPKTRVLPEIERLTGLTQAQLVAEGKEPKAVLLSFLEFVGRLPVVSHNAEFDCDFLRAACRAYDLPVFSNPLIDTCEMARRTAKGLPDYKLMTLAQHFQLTVSGQHRSMADCLTAKQLYEKLNEIGT